MRAVKRSDWTEGEVVRQAQQDHRHNTGDWGEGGLAICHSGGVTLSDGELGPVLQ